MKQRLLQLSRFGIVGVIAACVHISIVIFGVRQLGLRPLAANCFAYAIAFQVSYFGHKWWTFNDARPIMSSIQRFFLVASVGFGLNESLYYTLLQVTPLNYSVALVIVLAVVPALTFILAKYWAFDAA